MRQGHYAEAVSKPPGLETKQVDASTFETGVWKATSQTGIVGEGLAQSILWQMIRVEATESLQ